MAGMVGIIALLVVLAAVFVIFVVVIPIPLWIAAIFSGVRVSVFGLVGMRLRRVPPQVILSALIQARKAGLEGISSNALEAHYLAGGNVFRVIFALVAADKAGIPLTLQRATAIDLAGRDVLEAVKMSVNPKVIETPVVAAVAQDGIQLQAVARVTVRARNYSPHTNSWYPNRVQLQVHNASMKTTLVETSGDGFCPGNFEAYVSNSANATTKNNGSSANNDWQTLELEFTAPAGGSVSLGIFINNQGVTDSWHAVLIDDFRMEYVK